MSPPTGPEGIKRRGRLKRTGIYNLSESNRNIRDFEPCQGPARLRGIRPVAAAGIQGKCGSDNDAHSPNFHFGPPVRPARSSAESYYLHERPHTRVVAFHSVRKNAISSSRSLASSFNPNSCP